MMATPRFLEILLEEAARLRSLYPDLDRLGAALELAMGGGVVPVIKTQAALVRSEEPGLWLLVDGQCQCSVGQQNEICVHQLGWRLYELTMTRLQRELEELL
jgi:hypothetical protein